MAFVRVTIGPVPSSSTRAWVEAARRTLRTVRARPDLEVPAHVVDAMDAFVDEWAALAETGDVFEWSGELDSAAVRELSAHWLRLATLARERPEESDLAPAEAEGKAFYDSLATAMLTAAAADDDPEHFAEHFEALVPEFDATAAEPGAGEGVDERMKVLLVDDTADIRLLLRVALEFDERFEVVGEAADGAQAVAAVSANCPDVVVLDLAMPVMDGMTALPLLRQRCSDLRVVVLTAAVDPATRDEAMRLGAVAVLNKTASLEQIREAVAG